eukprot:7637169-Pyramimonas_sp.AAC.1
MPTEGGAPLGDNPWKILKRARTPFSELQRNGSFWLLCLNGPEWCQNATPGTSTNTTNQRNESSPHTVSGILNPGHP